MKIVDLDDDRNCFCGDDGDYENWNIDPEAIIEIVRCKYCIHNGSVDTDCPISWNGKEYCSFAERRDKG